MQVQPIPGNPYSGEKTKPEKQKMIEYPDAYLMQMNRQLGENTTHLKTLMVAFDSHVKKEEKHLMDDGEFKQQILAHMTELKERSFDNPEQKEWLRLKIQRDKDRHAVFMDVAKKVASGTVWAGLIAVFTLIVYGVKHILERGS